MRSPVCHPRKNRKEEFNGNFYLVYSKQEGEEEDGDAAESISLYKLSECSVEDRLRREKNSKKHEESG